MLFGNVLLVVAFLILLHAGFSAVHYEGLVTERYGDIGSLSVPADIYVELAIAVALALAGALSTAGRFVPIYSTGQASINFFHKHFAPRSDFAPMAVVATAAAATTKA